MVTARKGFTFIEILVVTVILMLLMGIVVVSFQSASKQTRDARRKKDLAGLQSTLEMYKTNVGSYPASSGCGGSWTWPGCQSEWIPGLIPDYLSALPTDPKGDASAFIGNLSTATYTYNYSRPTATTYILLTRLENTADPVLNGDDYGYSGLGIYVVSEPK